MPGSHFELMEGPVAVELDCTAEFLHGPLPSGTDSKHARSFGPQGNQSGSE